MMKKLLLLAAIGVTSATQAQVFTQGPFGTPPFWIETYDSLPNGGVNSTPFCGAWGVANRIGTTGQLWIGPPPPWFATAPHSMYGRGVDVEIVAAIPMRRFGGLFARMPPGLVQATAARFDFYDNSNNLIGSVTAPLTPTFTWIGWRTVPKWKRVEIFGNAVIPGHVAMDQTRMRSN